MLKNVFSTVLEILIVAFVVALLPKFGALIKKIGYWLVKLWIKICCKHAEKKFKGKKLGAKRKQYVLAKTQKYNTFLAKMDDSVDNVIEATVNILNTKSVSLKTSLQTDIPIALDETADKIVKNNTSDGQAQG
jgi:hypothetical protein